MRLVDGSTLSLGEFEDRYIVKRPDGRTIMTFRSHDRGARKRALRHVLEDAEDRANAQAALNYVEALEQPVSRCLGCDAPVYADDVDAPWSCSEACSERVPLLLRSRYDK
jgi:hypothetical protein